MYGPTNITWNKNKTSKPKWSVPGFQPYISLLDVTESKEWLVGYLDGKLDEDYNPVFYDGDGLG